MTNALETHQVTSYEISEWGNTYPIHYFSRHEGYIWLSKTVMCHACDQQATFRLEIYDHLYQPQGSLYYCKNHVPIPQDKRTSD